MGGKIHVSLVSLSLRDVIRNNLISPRSKNHTLILDTASSACIILVAFVGCPSHVNCVEPKYLARNSTPSISTDGVLRKSA